MTAWNWLQAVPAWFRLAHCRGAGTSLPYSTSPTDTVAFVREHCAHCPVLADCLDLATTLPPAQAEHGVWGGLGEHGRRQFRRLRTTRTHDDPHVQPGCDCGWCVSLRKHHAGLEDHAPFESFGTGATHGRRVTYAKGCRCEACSIAAVLPDHLAAKIPTKEKP